MDTAAVARFSTGILNVKDAPNFSWEYPVPVNDFWNSFRYPSARNFLTCFSQDEIDKMSLDQQYGSLSNQEKAQVLIKILRDKISSLESPDAPLWRTDNDLWIRLTMAIGTLHRELGQINEQIQYAEEMIEKQADKSNPSHKHALAYLLVDRGDDHDFERAEELERQCTEILVGKCGLDSPQAMSSRRIVAKAVWLQGRREEAEGLIAEIFELIESSASGKYAMYRASERKLTEEMVEELRKDNSMN